MPDTDLQDNAQPAEPLKSTPSGNRLASRTQADVEGKGDLEKDIKLDLKNAKKCGFRDILNHFIYLVLKKDSSEKRILDEVQDEIEAIQLGRYYPEAIEEDAETNPQLGNAGLPIAASQVVESERQGEGPEDPAFRTEREAKLVAKRDEILAKVTKDLLLEILPVANDNKIKQLLLKFEQSLKQVEIRRYGPYVNLCNTALDYLLKVGKTLPLRTPSKLNIRFKVADPFPIQSRLSASHPDVERKPDVVISSDEALGDTDYGKGSTVTLPSVLSCQEFKVKNRKNPHGTIKGIKTHRYDARDTVKETSHEELNDLDAPTTDENDAEPDSRVSTGSKRSRDAANLSAAQGQPPPKMRTPRGTPTGSRARSNANSNTHPNAEEKPESKKDVEGRVQCALYALEMLSYGPGVHHAINTLFTDGIFWIWYYDRQGILQSSGVSIFEDFPQFLILLFVFQRFSLRDWGIIPDFNPEAMKQHGVKPSDLVSDAEGSSEQDKEEAGPADGSEPHPESDDPNYDDGSGPYTEGKQGASPTDGPSPPVCFELDKVLENFEDFSEFRQSGRDSRADELSRIELDMNEYLSYRPHCLAGRATSVVSANGFSENDTEPLPMVCKIYHPEVQRRNEGLTLKVVYSIAEEDMAEAQKDGERAKLGDWSMFNHLPKFYFCGDVKQTSTHRIRSMVNCRWNGHRVMRVIGMKKLKKVTTVAGWKFVQAWLEGVICHEFLWRNYIEHGDPSLGNVMYDEETGCGVLTDFDLSLLQWEPRVIGTDRTGTIPFMALALLTDEYWTGKLIRRYHHELESFIWILPYVFLLYQGGERRKNQYVDTWRTADYSVCARDKSQFYQAKLQEASLTIQVDFRECRPFLMNLLLALRACHHEAWDRRDIADTEAELAKMKANPFLASATTLASNREKDLQEDFLASTKLWDSFVQKLESHPNVEGLTIQSMLVALKYFKPSFEPITKQAKVKLRAKYKHILHREAA